MKLPMKVAGMCWSLTFLVTAVPGFYQQTRPMDFATASAESFSGLAVLETLSVSLIGSFAAGMIGYMIGNILSHPQGKPKGDKEPVALSPPLSPKMEPESPQPTQEMPDQSLDELYPEEEPSDFETVPEEKDPIS